ncbi:MAG: helix-turn-helix domain-containing protein [Gammaproteobacteria bacterium]|nr:MAG: helix-turn-helix domain-containing protein [Gammaproteobacteria bacterium]
MQMSVQIIEKDGKPEYAVVPYEEWRRLQRLAEEVADIRAADAAMRALEAGEEALIPAAVADALLDGTPPLRAWRKYRGYTQRELAQMAGVSQGAIAQIESGRRRGSIRLLTRLARALDIEIADLLMED